MLQVLPVHVFTSGLFSLVVRGGCFIEPVLTGTLVVLPNPNKSVVCVFLNLLVICEGDRGGQMVGRSATRASTRGKYKHPLDGKRTLG